MDRVRWRDREPVNAAMFDRAADFHQSRFEYLVDRRDRFIDRLLFGALSLNAGSLLALLALLGGSGEAAKWLGFDPARAKVSAVAFSLGLISSTVAAFLEGNRQREECGHAEARRSASLRLSALYEDNATQEAHDRIGKELETYYHLPLVDFQYSGWSMVNQNIGFGCWLFGLCVPLLHLLR